MENITHTLFAVALSRASLNRKTAYATGALIVSANLPDIDLAWLLGGPLAYLRYGRGYTHCVLGVTLLAVALLLLFRLGEKILRRRSPSRIQSRRFFVVCWLGAVSHLVLDFLNSYGVRVGLPFSGRWFAADLTFIWDPWLFAILVLALFVPWITKLVTEEIGARPKTPPGRGSAIMALVLLSAFCGLRAYWHGRAVDALDARIYRGRSPLSVGAFPDALSPAVWHGVVETAETYELIDVNVLFPERLDPDRAFTYYKPVASPALDAAQNARTAKIFLESARFPLATVEHLADGWRVRIRDLRFESATRWRRSFVATVDLDEAFRVRNESFRLGASGDSGLARKPRK